MHLPITALLPLLLTLPLTSAHLELIYPPSRAFNEDTLSTFPCGGQNTPSATRTPWSLSGGPISLKMGHTSSAVQVLLGLGNDPGSAFNIVLLPTMQENAPGSFCIAGVTGSIPASLGIRDGDNATLQVVSNGDPAGGLYNCADITFKMEGASPPSCKNATGLTTGAYMGKSKNANGTDGATASMTMAGMPGATKASAGGRRAVEGGLCALAAVVVVGWATGL